MYARHSGLYCTEEKHIFVLIAMIMNNFLFCIYYALQCQWDPQGDWVSSLLILRCFKCHNITEFDCEDNDDVSHLTNHNDTENEEKR